MMNYTRLMPIQIGSKVADFSKPTVLLSDCHRRIEMFLGVLHRIAELENRLLTKDEQGSLEKALRYFHEAAPKHTADEEQSLFPRLRHNSQTEVQSALRELERLESDHQRATPMHAEIELLGKCWLAVGHLTSEQLGRFRELVAHLVSMYRTHIEFEDAVLFPLATRVLSSAEQSEMAREMAKRRTAAAV
jgi:hemerythrin-like domain-containing protein